MLAPGASGLWGDSIFSPWIGGEPTFTTPLDPGGGGGGWFMGTYDPFAGITGGGGSWNTLLTSGLNALTGFLGSRVPQVRTPQMPTLPDIFNPLPGLGQGGLPTYRVNVFGRRSYRRMNACNPRALKRAIRRVKRFEKFARQSVRIAHKVKMPRKRTCR